MKIWTLARIFLYCTAIIVWSLVAIEFGLVLAPTALAVSPTSILLILSYLIAALALKVGHDPQVFSNEPLDPNTSSKTIAIAAIGGLTLQLITSGLYMMALPVSPVAILSKITSDVFINIFVLGIFIPAAEEIGFRQILWNRIENLARKFFNNRLAQTITFVLVTTIFVLAHIPMLGAASLYLIPISCFFGILRIITKGIATSSIAHFAFNITAILWEAAG